MLKVHYVSLDSKNKFIKLIKIELPTTGGTIDRGKYSEFCARMTSILPEEESNVTRLKQISQSHGVSSSLTVILLFNFIINNFVWLSVYSREEPIIIFLKD